MRQAARADAIYPQFSPMTLQAKPRKWLRSQRKRPARRKIASNSTRTNLFHPRPSSLHTQLLSQTIYARRYDHENASQSQPHE